MDVRLDEDFDLFAAVGTGDEEVGGYWVQGSRLTAHGSRKNIQILLEGCA
jgi:hypothetical protein